ncbi:MAG TPA: hypothetical protein G4N93_06980 [Dehalococcoidia bacterium]|nr:hypothetical protein [Dehalococcoidia bacterium]
MAPTKETKDYWLDYGVVFIHRGVGFGLTERLENISLGKEADILKAFVAGEINENLNPIQRDTLMKLLEYRKQEAILNGDTESDMVGKGNDGVIGSDQKATRRLAHRQGLAVRSSKQKGKDLFR